MKKIYLLLTIIFISFNASAQSENEPNNSFATADLFDFSTVFTASIGNGDAIDYHRLNYLSNRNFYLLVEATNISGNDAWLKLDMYDGREGAGLIYTKNIANNLSIPDGETVYDTIYICGHSIDNYFLAFTTNEEFDYQIQWFPVFSYLPDEPNNTLGQAIPFALNDTKEGTLGYTFRGNSTYDLQDWYQSGVLPAGDYSDVKLSLEGINTSCTAGGGKNISYMVFKSPDLATPFAQGFIGNTNNAPQYDPVKSIIPLSNMQEGDIFYVRLTSNAAFGYNLRYSDLVPFVDPEDNCCYYNAIPLAEDSVAGGNVGEYDEVNDEFIDEFDTYRIIVPHDGAINVFAVGELAGCGPSDISLEFDLLDKYGNEILYQQELITWNNFPACGSMQYDTIKIRALAADTFFLRLRNYDSWFSNPIINYNIKYQFIDSTGSDPEPNNDIVSAIAVNPGQIKKGHINFKKPFYDPADVADYYKTNLPADGKMTIYLKSTFRSDTWINNSNSYRLGINYITNNVTYYSPSQTYMPTLVADSVIYDTIQVCPAIAGEFNFRIFSSLSYEYEFFYELTDTSSSLNDVEFNNTFNEPVVINYNEEKTGRLRYYTDRQGSTADSYDYYRTVTPYTGKVKIYVEATNVNCSSTANAIQLTVYDKRKSFGQLFNKNIAGVTTVPAGATIYDTITVCRLDADTLYMRFEATQLFRYKFRYEIVDTTALDFEPDNNFSEARFIGQGQQRKAHLGLTYGGIVDGNDYNKIAITAPGLLKIYFKAQNISCTDNRIFGIWGYRSSTGSYVFLKRYVLNAVGTIDAGQIVQDSISYTVPAATDTIFIRVEGNALFDYEFNIKEMAPTSSFSLIGDTTACIGPVYTYTAINVFNDSVTYNWSLPQGGGTLTYTDSIASVVWNENANRKIQLFLSNQYGVSKTKQLNTIINGVSPTQTPIAFNFARTLSTNSLPHGGGTQWFKNDTAIVGATDSNYYAADAGSYTVKFTNDCGPGPASNAIVFNADAQPQTISFPHVANTTMSPTAKVVLQATTSSALPVYYQKISGPGNISNDTLYITGAGTIIVKAQQPGDDVYMPAIDIFDTITVIKGNQSINFDSIQGQIYNSTKLLLTATSSMGLTVSYSIIAGSTYASVSGNQLTKKGAGTVTVRALQTGNANYNAATPVERTFCIGVRTLTPITGDVNPCINTYRYNTQKIPGANFVWTLSGGGILTTNNNDTAWVQWQTPGSHTLSVKANSPCDTIFTSTQVLQITTSNNSPVAVTNMVPANNVVDQQLPLTLSWIPGGNTVNYDLFVWDSAVAQPGTPYASNLSTFSYVLPKNSLTYNKTYKWQVVSKNPCTTTPGPIQQFRLRPLADLMVSNVQAPLTANSGQTVTISWRVTNVGPGNTLTNESWTDGVFFSFDTIPNFNSAPNWNPNTWSSLTANGRPLILGTKPNVSALDSGQFYTNSINFTLPINYSQPLYAYVITNYPHRSSAPLQVTIINDTARAPQPINVILSPTPDLRVDSVFAPGVIFSGSTINLSYKVKNYGVVTPVGVNWTDSVFISQNPLFDRTQSIPLTMSKTNGSYYPNAIKANAFNNTQLQQDSLYTKNIEVVIPNFIFGTWFIYVKTNANTIVNGFVYEGALNNNNVNQKQIQVYLSPTPKLIVSTLTLPVTTASITQPIGFNWNIQNEGFTDIIEKNKGHYFIHQLGSCPCSLPPGSPPGTVCSPLPNYADSLTQGSSYWVDRVYLSTDSTGLNISTALLLSELKHGVQQFAGALYPDNMTSCGSTQPVNVGHAIYPGSNFPKELSFNVPSNLQPGNYYVYVYTNPTKTVIEYPGTPQIKRSLLPITVIRPDVTVPAVSVPANTIGAQPVTISYNLINNGPGAVFTHARKDRLYISNFSSFDASAVLIATNTYTESLPVGVAVPHTFTHTMPAATTGAKYFYVETNYDSLFRETNYSNNVSTSAMTTVSAAIPADLVVTAVQPQDSVFTIFTTNFKYTVTNNGTGTTNGTWTDSVFISCSPVFNPATSYFIVKRTQSRSVSTGQSYSDTFNLNMTKMSYQYNSCFPQQTFANAYFYVKTNADSSIYEASNLNNNVGGSGSKVLVNPLVDHIVTHVTAADTTIVGYPYTVSWTDKNIGYNPSQTQYYSAYHDRLYLSVDSILDINDTQLFDNFSYVTLDMNEEGTTTRSPLTPNLPTGDYYLIAKTNANELRILAEKIFSNNTNLYRNANGTARKVHIIKPLLPDLKDSILSAPSSVAKGQPFTIIHRVTNVGTGATNPSTWRNTFRLSVDFLADNNNDGDIFLGTPAHNGSVLLPGEYKDDTLTVTIPNYIVSGNYILIGVADSYKQMVEEYENNNLGFSLLEVFTAPESDLIVSEIIAPDTVYLGYTIDTLKWVVQNNSSNIASGITKDGIYLFNSQSQDSVLALIGIKQKNINMQPLASDTLAFAPLVDNVTEGNYLVKIKTDLLDNITESDNGNNELISTGNIYVKAKELFFDINELNTLQDRKRYYKLQIPDSLIGSTILITLKTGDSLTMRNEMFIGGGYIPTPAHFNYRFEIPNFGNQQIVMTEITDSVYYIVVSCVSPNPVVQNITLKAVVLPFAILNVHTATGGNIGNVTVKISGSLFTPGMTAKIVRGGTTINASALYYTNSTTVFATFNLQGAPLGLYDISLTKPDSAVAIMINGFSVVAANNGGLITGGGPNTGSGNGNAPGCYPGAASGLNSQLVVELIVPPIVLITRPVVIQINFSNPTNFDIPAQTRILYSEEGLKMAFTKAGVPTGSTALYIELTEPGGPPGIIRPGGSGTITVHTAAPKFVPPDPLILFKLK